IESTITQKLVQVVATYTPQNVGIAFLDGLAIVARQACHLPVDLRLECLPTHFLLQQTFLDWLEVGCTTIGEDDLDFQHVINRLTVNNRAGASRVITGHTPNGGTATGRGIRPK